MVNRTCAELPLRELSKKVQFGNVHKSSFSIRTAPHWNQIASEMNNEKFDNILEFILLHVS